MYLDLAGNWHICLETDSGRQEGNIRLPGILQAQGFGNDITLDTPWVSSLHDELWWQREEYQYDNAQGVKVPFLAQPPRHFLGKAFYEKDITIEEDNDTWYLYIELTHWRTKVYVDGVQTGEDCSVCTAHKLNCGSLSKGSHTLKVEIDNSMQYPYRPDGHGVSDALGATWNGMAGEIALFTEDEWEKRECKAQEYAAAHPKHVEIKDAKFYIDGIPQYFRGTHFGGEYPITGYPVTDKAWWVEKMRIIKSWGLNFIRCHSYCPPDAAFAAADEEGVYIQPECGMWNHFEEGIPMLDILREETRRILRQFGHHPSFVLLSPTNEPSGNWYQVLRQWVQETRAYDETLGYAHRRVYTAESGWFYDVPPAEVKGVDYLYFHRSAYGPYLGGTVRGPLGWKGGNYSPSLNKTDIPVICHELGQWCSYPDFDVIEKFTGYLQPGNYEIFQENCRRHGLLELNKRFAYASGRNQLRLYKEDIEANLRTKELYGFELLDLHDYLGQGTALVGILDAFWQEKGYAKPEEFRQFCDETVLLAAFPSYVYTTEQQISVPVSICHFEENRIDRCVIKWEFLALTGTEQETVVQEGELTASEVENGCNTDIGTVNMDKECIKDYVQMHGHQNFVFRLTLAGVTQNTWNLYVYDAQTAESTQMTDKVMYTQDWSEAKAALHKGERVIYSPYLSDMNYECPPLSIRNAFWNGQMGPSWGRSLGMIVDTACPAFHEFPTQSDGGWQWEEILTHARGFHMQGSLAKLQPIVRVIDDWNRNLPLALIWEAQVAQGSLLVVSADLSDEFAKNPTAYCLRRALLQYVASDNFMPHDIAQEEDIERSLFPVLRMQTLTQADANPNRAIVIEQEEFPVEVDIPLNRQIHVKGILYVPDQRERRRASFPRQVSVLVWKEESRQWEIAAEATLANSSLSQQIVFSKEYDTNRLKFVVHTCYGEKEYREWKEYRDGYRHACHKSKAIVRIACLHVLCDEEAPHNNALFWLGQQATATKEIEA